MTTAPWSCHPNSHNSASCGTVGPQYHSALFLNASHELLFHFSCYAFPFIGHATPSSSTLLSLLSSSCAFSLTRRAGLLSCCAFCGLATCAALSFFTHRGHSLYLCPSSPYLKHFTTTVFTFLTTLSSAPYCITLLLNTSNLFWETTVPSTFSFSFLQFWARCSNPLQHLHNFPFLPSNSALNLTRVRFSLSRLLMRILYWVWDIVATSLGYGFNGWPYYCYVCWGTRSLPNQTPTALLTTALILWLDYYSTGEIPNLDGPLVVTITPLHIPTYNRAQHKVYTEKKTSILLNTTWLQGQVSVVIPKLGTTLPPAVPNWLQSPFKPRAQLCMEVVTDRGDQRLRVDWNEIGEWARSKMDSALK